jgi:hypothetical protein
MNATQYEENVKRMLKPNSRDHDLDADAGQIFMRNAIFLYVPIGCTWRGCCVGRVSSMSDLGFEV